MTFNVFLEISRFLINCSGRRKSHRGGFTSAILVVINSGVAASVNSPVFVNSISNMADLHPQLQVQHRKKSNFEIPEHYFS